jgi:hypothetical protein
VLLTRHRRIAQAAVELMRDEFGDDLDGRYEGLARAAVQLRIGGDRVQGLPQWEYDLPQHFLESRPDLAVRIAGAVLAEDSENAHLAVNLARILRDTGDPAAGARVLSTFAGPVRHLRGFWYEWGTCAGNAGDCAIDAVLAGWSLADQAAAAPPDNKNAKLVFAGLGVALRDLHTRYRDPVFMEGRGATAQLGMHLDLDRRTRGYLESDLREAAAAGVQPTDLTGTLARFRAALVRAWEVCGERETLALRMPEPKHMGFEGLRRLVAPDG